MNNDNNNDNNNEKNNLVNYDPQDTNPLDSSWISEFELVDNSYNMFYKDDVEYIHVNYVYLSNENEIERVKCENIILPTKNVLSYDILVSMVKAHKENDYKLAVMLKYNFSMNPEEVKFIHKHSFQSNYLQEIDKVDDIHYEKTITMFQDLNELTLFFTHNTKKHTRTQKIRMYDALKKQKKHTKKYHHV